MKLTKRIKKSYSEIIKKKIRKIKSLSRIKISAILAKILKIIKLILKAKIIDLYTNIQRRICWTKPRGLKTPSIQRARLILIMKLSQFTQHSIKYWKGQTINKSFYHLLKKKYFQREIRSNYEMKVILQILLQV